jgi:hypothetical protein
MMHVVRSTTILDSCVTHAFDSSIPCNISIICKSVKYSAIRYTIIRGVIVIVTAILAAAAATLYAISLLFIIFFSNAFIIVFIDMIIESIVRVFKL